MKLYLKYMDPKLFFLGGGGGVGGLGGGGLDFWKKIHQ